MIYAVNQQRVRYLVEFTIRGDVVKPMEIIHLGDTNILRDAVETTCKHSDVIYFSLILIRYCED